jgi:hypothetical protein
MFPQRDVMETTAGVMPAGTTPFILLSSYRKVKSSSRYLVSGAPTRCADCAQTFPAQGEHAECWHGTDNRYYCSETCAAKNKAGRKSVKKAA